MKNYNLLLREVKKCEIEERKVKKEFKKVRRELRAQNKNNA